MPGNVREQLIDLPGPDRPELVPARAFPPPTPAITAPGGAGGFASRAHVVSPSYVRPMRIRTARIMMSFSVMP